MTTGLKDQAMTWLKDGHATRLVLQILIVGGAVLIAMAISIWLLVAYGSRLTPIPVVLLEVDGNSGALMCPGDQQVSTIAYRTKSPLALEIYLAITDEFATYNYNLLLDGHTLVNRPHPGDHIQPISWITPKLPPGHYNLAVTMLTRGISSTPLGVYIPFEIGGQCQGTP